MSMKEFLVLGCAGGTVVLFGAGCGSISAHEDNAPPHMYAGVHRDAHDLAHPQDAGDPPMQYLNIIDFPFSATLDTILIPYDCARKPEPPLPIVITEPAAHLTE
jgi:uncharacterized protein YceK